MIPFVSRASTTAWVLNDAGEAVPSWARTIVRVGLPAVAAVTWTISRFAPSTIVNFRMLGATTAGTFVPLASVQVVAPEASADARVVLRLVTKMKGISGAPAIS